MPHIPLEDNFNDVIQKAQIGLKMTDEELAAKAEVSLQDLTAVKEGRPMIAVVRRLARHLRLSPAALEEHARKAWYPRPICFPRGFAMFNQAYAGELTVNSYLIWEPRSKVAAAFDTGPDSSDMLDMIVAEKMRLQYIFVTHTHEDHIGGLKRLREATGAQVWSSEREPCDCEGAMTFRENAHFHLEGLAIKTLLTWGHSPGLTTYFVTGLSWPLAIVGDALFASSMGGSEDYFRQQHHNVVSKILTLPKETVIAPGHGPLTTIPEERRHNPFFGRLEPLQPGVGKRTAKPSLEDSSNEEKSAAPDPGAKPGESATDQSGGKSVS